MTSSGPAHEDLRAIVRETLRDILPQALALRAAGDDRSGSTAVEDVRLRDDADLAVFVRRLLALYDDPGRRDDVRSGRLTFRLVGAPVPGSPAAAQVSSPHAAAVRVEKGAVTEAAVTAAAAKGAGLVLGRRAVMTPLAKERARSLGVHVEKEH